ncbi:hypothetical protein HD553DRAFT_58705 [Filobasidium floriforme]|uniref:uncharacterized protein n=1 Tax=Filobasidium floriforme TaxID=5210 RepID=UPI001E8E107C|nr:uncharacterized protein HD553DRAFT_58705 [Filobasidium floriforme]KAH8083263.1 hypothetical protein HD553DRAFT_58705 [Filobasidium floriforme]
MHFGNSLGGGVSGEDIWARSSIDAFRELGRTVLISYTLLETLDIYQAIPKLISRVIIDRIEVDQCVGYGRPAKLRLEDFAKGRARNMTDEEMLRWELQSEAAEEGSSWGFKVLENQDAFERGGCIRREGYPQGIPLWKIFSFHFWQGPGHPLGRNWTLSPEDYKKHPCQNGSPGNFYLGYSVEKYCQRFVDPPEQRLHRAYILAKYVHILDSDEFAWDSPNKTLFADLSEKYNISFVAGADHQGDVSIQKGIANMGRMPEDEFYKELALGRLVVGVGMPMISPTPYDALCLGVPFLNPLWRWDEKNPADSSAWCSQHDGLLEVGAPYVYHVRKRDLAHFEEAVAAAMERTIDPYIPPHMTADANRKRHQELLERDWESESVPFMAALQDDRFQMGIY